MKTRSMRPRGARFEVPFHVSRNFLGFVADSSRSYAKWFLDEIDFTSAE